MKQYGRQVELNQTNEAKVGIKYPIKMIIKTITFFFINSQKLFIIYI